MASQRNSVRSTRCQPLPALTRYQDRPVGKQTLLTGDCSVFTAAHAQKQDPKKDHSEPSFAYLFSTSGSRLSLQGVLSFEEIIRGLWTHVKRLVETLILSCLESAPGKDHVFWELFLLYCLLW